MLQEEYKSFMNEIKPEDGLVEAMVERQNRGRRGFALSKAMKVAVAVMCGLVVLAGGTVVVDAATGGAVRRLFGDDRIFLCKSRYSCLEEGIGRDRKNGV